MEYLAWAGAAASRRCDRFSKASGGAPRTGGRPMRPANASRFLRDAAFVSCLVSSLNNSGAVGHGGATVRRGLGGRIWSLLALTRNASERERCHFIHDVPCTRKRGHFECLCFAAVADGRSVTRRWSVGKSSAENQASVARRAAWATRIGTKSGSSSRGLSRGRRLPSVTRASTSGVQRRRLFGPAASARRPPAHQRPAPGGLAGRRRIGAALEGVHAFYAHPAAAARRPPARTARPKTPAPPQAAFQLHAVRVALRG